jgi:hypothetical protein
MDDEILTEITNFCETCPSKDCCPEDECVLFRIEQLVCNKVEVDEKVDEEKCDT